jgi:hypothetical protein
MPPTMILHSYSRISGFSGYFHDFRLFTMAKMYKSFVEEHHKLTTGFNHWIKYAFVLGEFPQTYFTE